MRKFYRKAREITFNRCSWQHQETKNRFKLELKELEVVKQDGTDGHDTLSTLLILTFRNCHNSQTSSLYLSFLHKRSLSKLPYYSPDLDVETGEPLSKWCPCGGLLFSDKCLEQYPRRWDSWSWFIISEKSEKARKREGRNSDARWLLSPD